MTKETKKQREDRIFNRGIQLVSTYLLQVGMTHGLSPTQQLRFSIAYFAQLSDEDLAIIGAMFTSYADIDWERLILMVQLTQAMRGEPEDEE